MLTHTENAAHSTSAASPAPICQPGTSVINIRNGINNGEVIGLIVSAIEVALSALGRINSTPASGVSVIKRMMA